MKDHLQTRYNIRIYVSILINRKEAFVIAFIVTVFTVLT